MLLIRSVCKNSSIINHLPSNPGWVHSDAAQVEVSVLITFQITYYLRTLIGRNGSMAGRAPSLLAYASIASRGNPFD
jgi:hypothetical protein